jgi:hypothetical protein
MMNMRWMYFAFLFNCLVYRTYAPTVICNSIQGYDIKTLTSVVGWQVTTYYQCLDNRAADCTYHIGFCQAPSACFNEYSACQNSTEASNVTILGRHTTTQFFANDSSIDGFYALYPPGPLQNISNTTRCQPKLRINFLCDLNTKWTLPSDNITGLAPEPIDIIPDPNDDCSTIMIFNYAGACKNGQGPTKDKISPGAIFVIVLFVSALVYFLIGAAYNGLVKHRSGINLIPNAKFWIGLPLHAIEGCRASLTCCSGTSKPSPATYASV